MAVAFNAPIGGLLFAFEEVASFFNTSLGWLIFFGEQHVPCSIHSLSGLRAQCRHLELCVSVLTALLTRLQVAWFLYSC